MSRIVRLPVVLLARGVSRTTHYREIGNGLFTRPVALGKRARGWPDHEVEAINAARIAGSSDTDIQRLVKRLEAERVAFVSVGPGSNGKSVAVLAAVTAGMLPA